MGAIPILPASVLNAGVFPAPTSAMSLGTGVKSRDGLKCVPMQFKFGTYAAWSVDLSAGLPTPPLSQIAAIYVDAKLSTHDIIIYFPDTGYQVPVSFGKAALVPALTGLNSRQFFVILDDNGNTNPDDVVNVIVMNEYVPGFNFELDSFQNGISYGYGQFFELQPSFTQSTTFSSDEDNTVLFSPLAVTLINATQWYITALDIVGYITTSGADATVFCLLDGTNNLLQWVNGFQSSGGITMNWEVARLSDLNIISGGSSVAGSGPLKATLNQHTSVSACRFTINICGGILVP